MNTSTSPPPPPSPSGINFFIIKATAIASIGGILFGYDLGVISGALPLLKEDFRLTDNQQEWVVGILYIGSCLGALIGGPLCDSIGRKTAIVVTDIIFAIGAILLYTASTVGHLLLGRIVVGFAVSISGIADVAYLHEMAPIAYRGAIVSVNEACISLGFLIAFGAGYWLEQAPDGWRVMFGISGALAILQFFGMLFMPESPVWLQQKGPTREAQRQAALRMIYGDTLPAAGSEVELAEVGTVETTNGNNLTATMAATTTAAAATTTVTNLEKNLKKSESSQYLAPVGHTTYESVPPESTRTPPSSTTSSSSDAATVVRRFSMGSYCRQANVVLNRYRCQVWIGIFLALAQQLCGQTSVLNYAPTIFSKLTGEHDLFSTLLIGIVKFVVTLLVIWKIEDFGRKFLLVTGVSIVGLGQCLVSIAFSLDPQSASTSAMFWALPGVLMVVCGYSMSFGPITWLLTSELFPTDIRGSALGGSTVLTNLCASMVNSTFFTLERMVGSTMVFLGYAIISGLSVVFVVWAIPETGGKSFDDIDAAIKHMAWWRQSSAKSRGESLPQSEPPEEGSGTVPPRIYDTEFT